MADWLFDASPILLHSPALGRWCGQYHTESCFLGYFIAPILGWVDLADVPDEDRGPKAMVQ